MNQLLFYNDSLLTINCQKEKWRNQLHYNHIKRIKHIELRLTKELKDLYFKNYDTDERIWR